MNTFIKIAMLPKLVDDLTKSKKNFTVVEKLALEEV